MKGIALSILTLSAAMTIQSFYAERDIDALKELCAQASDQETELLCNYRLYPLTQDALYLDGLPSEVGTESPRALALLSGLWGYKAAQSTLPGLVRYGRRSTRFLEAALTLDPHEPYGLLIQGQSLLFRPSFLGGDNTQALQTFRTLRRIVTDDDQSGISPVEVDLWIWYTLDAMDADDANTLKARLLASDLPPLYRQFVLDPPR